LGLARLKLSVTKQTKQVTFGRCCHARLALAACKYNKLYPYQQTTAHAATPSTDGVFWMLSTDVCPDSQGENTHGAIFSYLAGERWWKPLAHPIKPVNAIPAAWQVYSCEFSLRVSSNLTCMSCWMLPSFTCHTISTLP
jgi:hypothetical protein